MTLVSTGPGVLPAAAWLIDLDGTLYHALPMRMVMAAELAIVEPLSMPRIVRFRRAMENLRGQSAGDEQVPLYQVQCRAAALAAGCPVSELEPLIEKWMFQRPRRWLPLFRRRWLFSAVAAFRGLGGRTAIVSDYPAHAKLTALSAEGLFDVVVDTATCDGPRCLKPSPEGYLLAAQKLNLAPSACLVVGDRADADGAAATAAGMRYIHVNRRRDIERLVQAAAAQVAEASEALA